VAEGWNVKTGLGSRFGSHLLRAGLRAATIIWRPIARAPEVNAADGVSGGVDSAGIAKPIRALAQPG
jgi:hypothetical protein